MDKAFQQTQRCGRGRCGGSEPDRHGVNDTSYDKRFSEAVVGPAGR